MVTYNYCIYPWNKQYLTKLDKNLYQKVPFGVHIHDLIVVFVLE